MERKIHGIKRENRFNTETEYIVNISIQHIQVSGKRGWMNRGEESQKGKE